MTAPARATVASTWRPVFESDVAAAEIDALGTKVRVVAWPSERLRAVTRAVEEELRRLDNEASRFRLDSEISRLHARGGGLFFVSEGLAELIGVALAAARFTDGLVDPTIGNALVEAGYDRDFASIDVSGPAGAAMPAAGYRSVGLAGRLLRIPPGVLLDLGATAKGLGSDRAAAAALAECGYPGGVLVSLGGDIAVAGEPPAGGWPVLITESSYSNGASPREVVFRLVTGAVATSSTSTRRWQRAGRAFHHIIDPRTGLPAAGRWQMATVGAASCAEANAASTAAIVAGDDAAAWLESTGLPARLVGFDGEILLVGSWPGVDGGLLKVPVHRMSRGVPPFDVGAP